MLRRIRNSKLNGCNVGLFVVALSACASLLVQQVVCDYKEFDDLYNMAVRLESAEMKLQQQSAALIKDRYDLLRGFAREPKADHCDGKLTDAKDLIDQFRERAYSLLEERKNGNKNQGWFQSFLPRWSSALNQLKSLARFNQHLQGLVERYDKQAGSELTQVDIECDMIKVEVKNLHQILFVLNADVKHLILEDPRTLNRAIFGKLRDESFLTPNNFYNQPEVTREQSQILLDYFERHVDINQLEVGEIVDHYLTPGEFINGRLLDTCHAVQTYERLMQEDNGDYKHTCAASSADPAGNRFEDGYPFDKYDDLTDFCQKYLEAL